jgi:dienelactone hydrolase
MSGTQDFHYEHDGLALIGQIAVPEGPGPFPAVLVMHSAVGMDKLVRHRAQDLAKLGYVALATDMYGAGRGGPALDKYAELFMALQAEPAKLRARVVACYDALKARPDVDPARISAIGYCFGGQCVLELARSGADIKAAISFHGLLTTRNPAGPGTVRGKLMVLTGAKDPYAPATDVATFQQEMTDAGADWQVTVYGEAFHAFTEAEFPDPDNVPPGVQYDAMADRMSWVQATEFLAATTLEA